MARDIEGRSETSQGREVYDRLLDEIATGRLRPNARLTETEIAQRLGISRTPVREALRALEADGLVTHVPRVGAAVRALDHAEVMELYEMRTVLEGTAARLAARAASDIELAELGAILAEMAAAQGARLSELNRQFHGALLAAARNRFLTRSMEGLRRTQLILGATTLADPERRAAAEAEHGRVMAALRARDGPAAEAAMRAHIEAAQRARLRQLREAASAGPPGSSDAT
jgi:DNA-binding GntR family transcriptional regulator